MSLHAVDKSFGVRSELYHLLDRPVIRQDFSCTLLHDGSNVPIPGFRRAPVEKVESAFFQVIGHHYVPDRRYLTVPALHEAVNVAVHEPRGEPHRL